MTRKTDNAQKHTTKSYQTNSSYESPMKRKSYAERLKRLGLPTLEYRRERADMVEVYKIMNNIDLTNQEKLFQMATFQAIRGHPLKLFKRRSWLNLQANSFSMRFIDNWNSLPTNEVLAPSVNSLKSRLNKQWHGHPLKFEASCYIPGVQPTLATQQRNASLQAT